MSNFGPDLDRDDAEAYSKQCLLDMAQQHGAAPAAVLLYAQGWRTVPDVNIPRLRKGRFGTVVYCTPPWIGLRVLHEFIQDLERTER